MLAVLGLINMVMITNLLVIVIIGELPDLVRSRRIRSTISPDQPEWLFRVNTNMLKVKLAMAIIGIFVPSTC